MTDTFASGFPEFPDPYKLFIEEGKKMEVYTSVQEMIGHTPMLKLGHMGVPEGVNLYAKLELMNPAGSVKDRVGEYMIHAAEKDGTLKPGGTIIEGTAGNTGIGIAIAALNKGYRVIFAVPEKFSEEKKKIMAALGAEIVSTPRADGMLGAEKKAEELKSQIPGAITLRQFLVAGAGSGGTFSGIVKYLKEKNPSIQGVLADPYGSIIGGGEHGDYDIEGIGNDFIAETMDMKLVDKVYKVTDDEAYGASRTLAKKEGILAGSSSGAALSAALRLAEEIGHGNIVVVFPDRGDRYLSKGLYD